MEATAQAIYSDLVAKTDPQGNALIAWKNESSTFGALLQVFDEVRHERRDGQEIFGYGAIDPTWQAAIDHPDLAGVMAPYGINSALFEQTRKRSGGLVDVQWKPMDTLTLDVNGFYSNLKASNYNRSFYNQPMNNLSVGLVPSSYKVVNGTLVQATFDKAGYPVPSATPDQNLYAEAPATVDQIYRPGASASSSYLDLSGEWRVTDMLKLTGLLGTTKGEGKTPRDIGYEANFLNSGMSYTLNPGGVASVTFPGGDPSTFSAANVTTGAAWGSKVQTEDKEHYGQLDAELALDKGVLESLKFGARFAEHQRTVALPQASGCTVCDGTTNAPLPNWSGTTYPGNFGKGLGSGVLANVWQLSRNDIIAWANQYDPLQPSDVSEVWSGEMKLKERDSAAYAMANLQGTHWSGNVGVRLVRTVEASTSNLPSDLYPDQTPLGTNNANGTYVPVTTDHTFNNILPSANLRYDLTKSLVARASIARVMSRADYGALVSAVNLDDNLHTGSGGNPDLKPILSTNTDLSLEWYYAPKALLSVGLFYMDMSSYVAYGNNQARLHRPQPQPAGPAAAGGHLHAVGAHQHRRHQSRRGAGLAADLRRGGRRAELHVYAARCRTAARWWATRRTRGTRWRSTTTAVQRARGLHVPLVVPRGAEQRVDPAHGQRGRSGHVAAAGSSTTTCRSPSPRSTSTTRS